MTEAFPLQWPAGRPKTEKWKRRSAPFKTTIGKARDELLHELKLLGARNIVISSNVATYTRAGQQIMYADQTGAKEEPGIAVYYSWEGEQYCMSCDKWNNVSDNIQACNKAINALRGIERWGTGDMMKAAFTGFKALPEAREMQWWDILGINSRASKDQIKDAYRKKAMQHHPDRGGNAETFHKIQKAYETAIAD